MAERKEYDLMKKTEQMLKKTGEESNFPYALKFHLTVLRDSKTEDEIETREELCQYLLSKMFLDKIDLYPTQPFKCETKENSDWPLLPLPAEVFGSLKQGEEDKIFWFYKYLKFGDVLDCRVSSDSLIGAYQLRVIHKYGVTKLLDDLQIMVLLRCAKGESKVLEKPLLVLEFVRVAVCEIRTEDDGPIVYVTVDKSKFEETSTFRPLPKLGRITEDDIPSYVFETPDTEKFPSYSDYLISKPQFHNPHFYSGLLEGCGIDSITVCSYFPEYNRKPCNESQTGQALLKDSKFGDAKLLAGSALRSLDRKQYDDGFKLLEDALKICPSDDSLMSKLYDIRSDMHAGQLKSILNMKSLCDLEMAFKIAPDDDQIKQKFLHQIFKVSNHYMRRKMYKRAVIGFEFILKCNKDHRLAARALDHIKTKHADKLLNLEGMSQIDLQEKKKELLTELKKMKTS